ncbi:hypothetical protein LR48_Vigan661s001500 [Vigna angularis]|uniref:Uncharacterized protein n=1 Tax=Phaseolus angularis TaxID=3914 RepID=A0A0L9TFK2_PHAAN|nr:hypothetical protein LR48_Vigan661s001500 [Vigna angularis]
MDDHRNDKTDVQGRDNTRKEHRALVHPGDVVTGNTQQLPPEFKDSRPDPMDKATSRRFQNHNGNNSILETDCQSMTERGRLLLLTSTWMIIAMTRRTYKDETTQENTGASPSAHIHMDDHRNDKTDVQGRDNTRKEHRALVHPGDVVTGNTQQLPPEVSPISPKYS